MAKLKTLEHLRAEKERAETQLAQEQHMAGGGIILLGTTLIPLLSGLF